MTYSKVWTQFETQAMAFTKLRMGLYPNYLVRGYDGYISIYKPTVDQSNPQLIMKIYVRASTTKEEVGFFKKESDEFLLIGGDAAWLVAESVKEHLARAEGA